MGRRIFIVLSVIAATVGLGAPPAVAATFSYPSAACPAGPTGLTDCITNASAGDVIKVKKGTYYENVVVSEDVTVKAAKCDPKNTVTIDAAPPAPPASAVRGIGFDITTDGVTIDCITVRHATTAVDNDGAAIGFDNITVRRLTVIQGGKGVFSAINADNLLVEKSIFKRSDGEGVQTNGGSDLRLLNNRCSHMGNDCLDVSGSFGALIKGNSSRVVDDGGLLEIDGSDEAEIRNNTGQDSDNAMIETFSMKDFIVDGNVSTNTSDNAFDIRGVDFQLTNNKALGFYDDAGINADVGKDPTETLISGNVVTGSSPDDDNGIDIDATLFSAPCAAPPCVRILNNRLANSVQDGYRIRALFAEIRGNIVTDTGESDSSQGNGFNLDVSTSTVVENTSTGSASDGFQFSNSGNNVISDNVARGNGLDGIHLISTEFGLANIIDANDAIGNHGDGIENDAAGVTMTENVSKKNRFDCASSVVLVVNTNNTCADGSDFTQNGTID